MKCSEIAAKIEKSVPTADPLEVARVCTLISSCINDHRLLEDDDTFMQIWQDVNLRLAAATDQHEAVTSELEELACSDPREFDPGQIWILVRAINIQSQVLRMYVGDPTMDLHE